LSAPSAARPVVGFGVGDRDKMLKLRFLFAAPSSGAQNRGNPTGQTMGKPPIATKQVWQMVA
jgi:hypothetical protein